MTLTMAGVKIGGIGPARGWTGINREIGIGQGNGGYRDSVGTVKKKSEA